MKTLNLLNLQNRLGLSFTGIRQMIEIDVNSVNNSMTRTVSVFNFDGFNIGVHVSTNGTLEDVKNDTAIWFRFFSINGNRFFTF